MKQSFTKVNSLASKTSKALSLPFLIKDKNMCLVTGTRYCWEKQTNKINILIILKKTIQ